MRVVQGIITSVFGMRMHPILKVLKMHNGVDISAPTGTPVYCPADGRVVSAGFTESGGDHVHVQSGTLTFVFMHLSARSVTQSQIIAKGQQIGLVGSTGMSTAPHLHFEVRLNHTPINPMQYIEF